MVKLYCDVEKNLQSGLQKRSSEVFLVGKSERHQWDYLGNAFARSTSPVCGNTGVQRNSRPNSKVHQRETDLVDPVVA
jgi:hypothetical protein